jgi:hypothetical protein
VLRTRPHAVIKLVPTRVRAHRVLHVGKSGPGFVQVTEKAVLRAELAGAGDVVVALAARPRRTWVRSSCAAFRAPDAAEADRTTKWATSRLFAPLELSASLSFLSHARHAPVPQQRSQFVELSSSLGTSGHSGAHVEQTRLRTKVARTMQGHVLFQNPLDHAELAREEVARERVATAPLAKRRPRARLESVREAGEPSLNRSHRR